MGSTIIVDRIKKCYQYDTKAGQVTACKVVLKDEKTGKKQEAVIQYPVIKNENAPVKDIYSFSVATPRCDPKKDAKCSVRLSDLL